MTEVGTRSEEERSEKKPATGHLPVVLDADFSVAERLLWVSAGVWMYVRVNVACRHARCKEGWGRKKVEVGPEAWAGGLISITLAIMFKWSLGMYKSK
jgi:hypothetical protein